MLPYNLASFRVTFEGGSYLETEMSATLEEAEAYYLGKETGWRLTSDESGPLLKVVKVEQI